MILNHTATADFTEIPLETALPLVLTVKEGDDMYDPYRDTDNWSLLAQVSLWRERAIHQSQRADFYRRLSEASKAGTTVTASDVEPRL